MIKLIKASYKIGYIIFVISSLLLCLPIFISAQGLPTTGTAKLLIIYSDVNDSTTFQFKPQDLSDKLIDFYSKMSLGKLNIEITSLNINIEVPQKLTTYTEAIVFLLEKTEDLIDLEEFSEYEDKSILDGICIVFDDFYAHWLENPIWSGIANIILNDQTRTFDNKLIQIGYKTFRSSGLVMRTPNDLDYSFWVLAHEIGHLLGLTHHPVREQIPYYQLMNSSGINWGINRGMSFWERERLGWIKPEIKLDLSDLRIGFDSLSFYLNDYMSTGNYAKIIFPRKEFFSGGKIILVQEDAFYLENRTKISPYDQDKNKGDEGIFIWRSPGKLISADGIKDFSYYPTNDAFGAPNIYSNEHQFNYNYYKIKDYTPNEGYYDQKYILPINLKIAKDNKITIIYGPVMEKTNRYIVTASHINHKIKLHENYPNPFNPSTKISFLLYRPSRVNLEIFDMIGQKVVTLADKFLNAGNYTFTFDATNYTSGTYIYRIKTGPTFGEEVYSRKMQYIK